MTILSNFRMIFLHLFYPTIIPIIFSLLYFFFIGRIRGTHYHIFILLSWRTKPLSHTHTYTTIETTHGATSQSHVKYIHIVVVYHKFFPILFFHGKKIAWNCHHSKKLFFFLRNYFFFF